jgi:hypothetical protein
MRFGDTASASVAQLDADLHAIANQVIDRDA